MKARDNGNLGYRQLKRSDVFMETWHSVSRREQNKVFLMQVIYRWLHTMLLVLIVQLYASATSVESTSSIFYIQNETSKQAISF